MIIKEIEGNQTLFSMFKKYRERSGLMQLMKAPHSDIHCIKIHIFMWRYIEESFLKSNQSLEIQLYLQFLYTVKSFLRLKIHKMQNLGTKMKQIQEYLFVTKIVESTSIPKLFNSQSFQSLQQSGLQFHPSECSHILSKINYSRLSQLTPRENFFYKIIR